MSDTPQTAAPAPTAAAEWRKYWLLALASTAGFTFPATATYSLGLFMDPLHKEFGWNKAQISSGLLYFGILAVLFAPFIGALIDKFGARMIGIPGTIITIIAIGSFGFADGSMAQWAALWMLYSLGALFTKPTIWTAAVSGAFTTSRGLALGLVLCGTGISQSLTPIITQQLIDNYGWRSAYHWLALGWGGLVLVLLLLFFHDMVSKARRDAKTASVPAPVAVLAGYGFVEAIRSRPILQIFAAVLIGSFMTVGISIHLVPILGEAGLSRAQAAGVAGLGGVAGIAGKLITGVLLDKFRGNIIPFTSFALPSAGIALLALKVQGIPLIALAVFILGYAGGASGQSAAYLISRYGGMRSFGKIFGIWTSIAGLGLAIGPQIASHVFDTTGSYSLILMAAIPANIIAGLLVIGLGPYPIFTAPDKAAPVQS